MSLVLTINYDQSGNFLFDSDLVEFDVPLVTLKEITRIGETFAQDFSSSAGFTFDAAKTEFSGGVVQQLPQYSGADSVATYTANIDLNFGGGILTGTAFGGATITSNKLDLSGNVEKHVTYDGTSNFDGAIQTGAIKFKFTPDYNGSPAADFILFCITQAAGINNNQIILTHKDAGAPSADQIQLTILSSTGGFIINGADLGTFVAVSGVENEFELNWDITTGATQLFIDGVQLGATQTGTGTRTSAIDFFRFGDDENGGNVADGFIADLIYFNSVQHTSNYTPGYTLTETKYVEDLITLPAFTDPFGGAIQAFTGFTTVQSGLVRFNVDGQYWNGGAWVASDDSYAQMNDPVTINSNIATLGIVETFTVKSRTTSTNILEDIDNLTIIYNVLGFSSADPTVLQNSSILVDALEGFVETTSIKPSGTDIKYILVIDSQDTYWDGAVWTNSDGTYAQANTAIEIETNKGDLNITSGVNFKLNAFLHSDTGIAKPSLTTVTINYSFFINPIFPPECVVFGWALDMEGNGDAGATIKAFVPGNGGFFHGNNLVFVQSETTADSNGYWEMSLVETATIGKSIRFNIVNSDGETQEKETFIDVIIPNQATVEFSTIATPPAP